MTVIRRKEENGAAQLRTRQRYRRSEDESRRAEILKLHDALLRLLLSATDLTGLTFLWVRRMPGSVDHPFQSALTLHTRCTDETTNADTRLQNIGFTRNGAEGLEGGTQGTINNLRSQREKDESVG